MGHTVMKLIATLSLLTGCAPQVVAPTCAASVTWPVPTSCTSSAGGQPRCVAANVTVRAVGTAAQEPSRSPVLRRGAARYEAALRRTADLCRANQTSSTADPLITLVLLAPDGDALLAEKLGLTTNYSYSLSVPPVGAAQIGCSTHFGCLYGLETLLQELLPSGYVTSGFAIRDAPEYAWRGMMLDASSRFAPVEFIKSQIEAMSVVKMSVLHLHLSEGAYRLPTDVLPALNRRARHWTRADVESIVAYAKDRGIRVVPEVHVRIDCRYLCCSNPFSTSLYPELRFVAPADTADSTACR